MAAPRATCLKALRSLQRASSTTPAKRSLHMTGSREAPQHIEPARKTIYTTWGFQELRNECQSRTLTSSGTKHELINRLAAHDSLQHRALHMGLRRAAKDQQQKAVSGPANAVTFRTFNTSRANKAVHDTSTIDFAYLPKLYEGVFITEPAAIRVPILPHIESEVAEAGLDQFPELDAAAGGYHNTDIEADVMKAQIQSADAAVEAYSPMSDVHDGHHPQEMSVETLTKLTETVSGSAKQLATLMKNQNESDIRKVWNGFLDDIFGKKRVV